MANNRESYRTLEATCAAYASLNLSLLHSITLPVQNIHLQSDLYCVDGVVKLYSDGEIANRSVCVYVCLADAASQSSTEDLLDPFTGLRVS